MCEEGSVCLDCLHYEEGAGRPSTATTDDNIERVRDMVLLDRSDKSSANYWQAEA